MHVRTVILTLLSLSLIAPAAQAGAADVNATVLDDPEDTCEGSASSDGGSWSYPPVEEEPEPTHEPEPEPTPEPEPEPGTEPVPGEYRAWGSWYEERSSTTCESERTFVGASAGDDQGELASASVGESSTSTVDREERWYDSTSTDGTYYSTDHGHRQMSEDEESSFSGAEIGTTVADARAGTACQGHASEELRSGGQYDSWPEGERYASGYEYEEERASECFTGVQAEHAGREVRTGQADSCESRDTAAGGYDHTSYDGRSYDQEATGSTHDSSCRSGATVEANGQQAFVGSSSDCASTRSESTWSSDGESYQWRAEESSCTHKELMLEGPMGLQVVLLGESSGSWEECWEDDESGEQSCDGDAWTEDERGVTWDDGSGH